MILLNRKFGQIFFFGEYWWTKCFLGTSVVSEEKKEKKNGDRTRISSMLEKID